jgi:hypothetical protein
VQAALLLAATLSCAVCRADHYDVYVLAGQSNAGGHGYALEWSTDLVRWNLFRIVPAGSGAATQDTFPDPGGGLRLFLRIR